MSEPTELTPEQMAELWDDLRALRAELEADLRATSAAARPVEFDQQAIGRVSRIDAIQHQQMARASTERARSRLALVKRALAALDLDDYGRCRRCEEAIGFRRLKARPESPICLRCQAALERR